MITFKYEIMAIQIVFVTILVTFCIIDVYFYI